MIPNLSVVAHFDLLFSFHPQYPALVADDMVKIDLGAHIDGYIVLAAHTLIVGADLSTVEAATAVQSGRRAAVINAAYTAAEVAAKLIKNGTLTYFYILRAKYDMSFHSIMACSSTSQVTPTAL